jgi:hypothetical protein
MILYTAPLQNWEKWLGERWGLEEAEGLGRACRALRKHASSFPKCDFYK